MFRFYDHAAGEWRSIAHPTAGDITAALMAAVDAGPPCECCDAVVQLHIAEDVRVVGHTVVHEDYCPRRVA